MRRRLLCCLGLVPGQARVEAGNEDVVPAIEPWEPPPLP